MKIILKIATVSGLMIIVPFLFSCQKDKLLQETSAIAKVNVISAVVGGGDVKANVSAKEIYWSSISNDQSFGGNVINRLFMVSTDKSILLKVAPLNDTTKLWYNEMSNLKSGKMYTLYLLGTPNQIDTLFREESKFPKVTLRDLRKPIPATDSIVNIRFVNLSASGPAVDISITGNTSKEAVNLGYRKFTDFKIYDATSAVEVISFEIRRSSTQEIIGTSYVDVSKYGNLFKTLDIVIKGVFDPDLSLPIPDEDRYALIEVPYQ